jgi:hypothetical protein
MYTRRFAAPIYVRKLRGQARAAGAKATPVAARAQSARSPVVEFSALRIKRDAGSVLRSRTSRSQLA